MNKNNSSLLKGIVWSSLEILIKRVLDLVVKLILARLLFPEDFGIIGMATVFTSLIQVLNDAGMGSALIQRKKEDLNEKHFHTVFWTSIIWSFFLFILVSFVIAPIAANFYNTPLLNEVIPILSISILSNSLNVVHKAKLMRGLKFKKLAFINNISSLLSGGLSIIMALYGFGVWSLVFNSVAAFVISVPLFYLATKWVPKFLWDKTSFKDVFSFGVFTTFTQLIESFTSNVDYLVIGKLFSSTMLGTYTLAYMLTNMVKAQISSMLNRVMFPFYSSIQNDVTKVKGHFLEIIKYYSLIIYPLMLILLIYGEPLILSFFGEKWRESIIPMKILAVSVLIDSFVSGYGLLFRSIGKSRFEMKIHFFTAIFIFVPSIIFGAYFYRDIGVSFGILVSNIFNVIIAFILLNKYFKTSFKEIIKTITKPFLSFTFALIISILVHKYLDINFIIKIFILLIVYFIVVFFLMRKEIKQKIKI
jgi:O-antigen/teichoic acid export membrane protein